MWSMGKTQSSFCQQNSWSTVFHPAVNHDILVISSVDKYSLYWHLCLASELSSQAFGRLSEEAWELIRIVWSSSLDHQPSSNVNVILSNERGYAKSYDGSKENSNWPSVPPSDHLSLKCSLYCLASSGISWVRCWRERWLCWCPFLNLHKSGSSW